MTTNALISSLATVQAAPTHTRVWPVLVITTVLMAAAIAGLRRLRSTDRAVAKLVCGFVVLAVAAFGVVVPVLLPAREQLDTIAHSAGGADVLAFIALTSTVGVAACLLVAAQFLRVLVTPIVRKLTQSRAVPSTPSPRPGIEARP